MLSVLLTNDVLFISMLAFEKGFFFNKSSNSSKNGTLISGHMQKLLTRFKLVTFALND